MSDKPSSKKRKANAQARPRPSPIRPDPKKATLLAFISHMFWEQCLEIDGSEDDIRSFTSILQYAIDLHPEARPEWQCLLGQLLVAGSARVGGISDIKRAIRILCPIRKLTGHYRRMRLGLLGQCFATRFRHSGGQVLDLQVAIAYYERAIDMNPVNMHMNLDLLTNLCISLFHRSQLLGDPADIDRAIATMWELIVPLPSSDHRLPQMLDITSGLLLGRFDLLGRLADLESALHTIHRAIDITPDDQPYKPFLLANLGMTLTSRFERLGDPQDLDSAIITLERLVKLIPDGHSLKPGARLDLGNCFMKRCLRIWGLDRESGRMWDSKPPMSPEEAKRFFDSRSKAHQDMLERLRESGVVSDLDRAQSLYELAIEQFADDSIYKHGAIANRATCLMRRFELFGGYDDLEHAISTCRRALELAKLHDMHKAQCNGILGSLLYHRAVKTHNILDLRMSIITLRTAVQTACTGQFPHTHILLHLSTSLCALLLWERSQKNFDYLVQCLTDIMHHKDGDPEMRLYAAEKFMDMHSLAPEFSTPDTVLLTYSLTIDLLPEIVWLGRDPQKRYKESARFGKLVTSAIAFAIKTRSLSLCVEWLESGRALIWSQVLSLQTPLNNLARLHPELAADLTRARDDLRRLQYDDPFDLRPRSRVDGAAYGVPGIAADEVGEQYRRTALRYEEVLKEIRQLEGFESFLLQKKFPDIMASLKQSKVDGPVIFLNVVESQCDAVVVSPEGHVRHIPLPRVTEQGANKLYSMWKSGIEAHRTSVRATSYRSQPMQGASDSFVHLLERIWTLVVKPILQELGLLSPTRSGKLLPHVTWCPTGPLAQLPLHAAGVYGPSPQLGQRVFDYVVSSYAPSLTALLRCYQSGAERRASPSILILTQPATPGQARLPGTRDEGLRIRKVLSEHPCTILEHMQATVRATLAVLDQHPWVHFACHASQNTKNPTESAFELFDGPLTLSALMSKASGEAELAFLSACQTATGDKNIPEESAHLAAGMLSVGFKGVVATMWSIWDADAPVVVEAYYQELVALRRANVNGRGGTGAAYALHAAVKTLRDKIGENSFERWVPFVHFGA
ncbi:unnamed protein product [Peniophora sp. CBMAI 1063]|nr:unnamed protein product [Peniophora sp. CBMAI 1063]